MAGSVNKVILIGNLGRDPEVRNMQSGDKVANLAIATSERWKDRNGERQERTEWHRVVIFSQPLVNVAEQYLRKGAKVYLEGQLETRKWTDQNGQEKYSTEIVLRPFKSELTMLDSRGSADMGGMANNDFPGYDNNPGFGGSGGSSGGSQGGGAQQAAAVDELEDEIPF